MPRFQNTTQKYDQYGNKVPKGLNGIKNFVKDNPDCVIFDSKSEYEIYLKLKNLESEGFIQNLELKETFPLLNKRKWWNNFRKRWDIIREVVYITDFSFTRDGQKVVVDCKGWKEVSDKKTGKIKARVYYDEVYKLKKKMFLEMYPGITFEEL